VSNMDVETHVARVTANNDPEERGRIRVACVALLGDDETELPMWVEPALPWGMFAVPDVGELVEIEVLSGSRHDESYGQMSLDNLDPKWKGARFFNEDEDVPTPVHDDFKTHYGKRRGFATPFGHVLMFDDTTDDPSLWLAWTSEKGSTDATKRTVIHIDKNGHCELVVKGEDSIKLEPGKVSVRLGGGATLVLEDNGGSTTATVGDGAMHVAIVEHLRSLYNNLKSYIENATVQTGMGPSSTIQAASGPAPAWDSSIESTKVSIPDG
jgi:hypothetical protein